MNEPKPPLKLSAEERRSPLWRKLVEHWTDRLEALRSQNDGDRDAIATAKLRGLIAGIKATIELGKDPKE